MERRGTITLMLGSILILILAGAGTYYYLDIIYDDHGRGPLHLAIHRAMYSTLPTITLISFAQLLYHVFYLIYHQRQVQPQRIEHYQPVSSGTSGGIDSDSDITDYNGSGNIMGV